MNFKIRRYSFLFVLTVILAALSSLVLAFISFSSNATYEKCRDLGFPILKIETEYGKKIKSKEEYLEANYSFENSSGKCKIRGHGNTTWRTRELYKKPYLIKTDDEVSFFGLPESRKWILLANTADKSSLRNFFSLNLAQNVFNNFSWTPKMNFITLFVNGRYEGLYAITEKVEIQPGRIEIDTEKGSFLAEINLHLDRIWNFLTSSRVPVSIRKPEDLSDRQYEECQKKVQELEDLIMASSDSADKLSFLEQKLDFPSLIDWYLINEFTKNHDARDFSSNFFYYDAVKDKFFFSPVWDFDIALGNISWDECERSDGWWIKNSIWFNALFKSKDFESKVKSRWNEKKAELKDSFKLIDEEAGALTDAMELNDAVWKNIGRKQWPHAPQWKKRKTYKAEVDYLKEWCQARFSWMDENLSQN